MAKPAQKAKKIEVEVIDDVEQGSDEWFALRLGIPTASCFAMIMAEGQDGNDAKGRATYMRKLAGELMTGAPGESGNGKILTAAMARGNEMEPEAIEHYERTTFGAEVERVGFVRRLLPSGRYVGCSPDGLLNKRRKGLEIKTLAPHRMIARLEAGARMPPEHRWQVIGTMWVGALEEVELMLFYRGMPVSPRFRVERTSNLEREISRLSNAVEIFDHELHKLVGRVKAMGAR